MIIRHLDDHCSFLFGGRRGANVRSDTCHLESGHQENGDIIGRHIFRITMIIMSYDISLSEADYSLAGYMNMLFGTLNGSWKLNGNVFSYSKKACPGPPLIFPH